MSIVALIIAPQLEGHDDWENAYLGLIPLAIMILGTVMAVQLFWRETADLTADFEVKTPDDVRDSRRSDSDAEKGERNHNENVDTV